MKQEGPLRKRSKLKSEKRDKPKSKEDNSDMPTRSNGSNPAGLCKKTIKPWMSKSNNHKKIIRYRLMRKSSLTIPWPK